MFVKVGTTGEVPLDDCKVVDVNGTAVALCNVAGTFYAVNNRCPHVGGPLGKGALLGKRLICPWHGWEFDVTNGAGTTNPEASVACFEVRLEGEDVLVSTERQTAGGSAD